MNDEWCLSGNLNVRPGENIYFPCLMSSLSFALRPAGANRGLVLWPQCIVQFTVEARGPAGEASGLGRPCSGQCSGGALQSGALLQAAGPSP